VGCVRIILKNFLLCKEPDDLLPNYRLHTRLLYFVIFCGNGADLLRFVSKILSVSILRRSEVVVRFHAGDSFHLFIIKSFFADASINSSDTINKPGGTKTIKRKRNCVNTIGQSKQVSEQ